MLFNKKRIFASAILALHVCPRGEIGRHAILRGWCHLVCWFESSRGHSDQKHLFVRTGAFLFFPESIRSRMSEGEK